MSTATEPTLTCGYCSSITDAKDKELEWTWQQWQCPHCGSWNDWKEAERIHVLD
jgi:transposase